MTVCAHFLPEQSHCAKGVGYMGLAGGGVFGMVLRLPCVPLLNRRGEEVRTCAQFCGTEIREIFL